MIQTLIRLRRGSAYLVLVAVAAAAVLKLPVTFCAVKLGPLQLICPVGFIEISLATKSLLTGMLPGVLIVLALSLLLGRSYCSWACPARHAAKGAAQMADRKIPMLARPITGIWHGLRKRVQKHVSLTAGDGLALLGGLLVGITIFDVPAYSLLCPVGVVSRNLIELVTHYHLRFDLLFLTLPLALGLMFKSGWKCACPMGLVRGVAATPNRTLQPVIDYDNCLLCNKCMEHCNFGVNLHAKSFDNLSCSRCLNCLRDCDHNAIELKLITRPTPGIRHEENSIPGGQEQAGR